MKTRALQQKKPLQPYFIGRGTFTCAYHPKTKIPTLRCITDNKIRTTHIRAASTLAQQPSNKGRKCVIFHEPEHATTPAAYASNLNTSQQELLRLHETYAHANKFIEAQRPEIEGLMDINTFEFIPNINLPPKTRYLNLIWTYRRKCCPGGSLKKYKARLCVNCSRQIQGIDYIESSTPVVQWSAICMVNTLAAMHNLKGKQIDFTQAFPQAKFKEDIYLRFPAGFEHKNEKCTLKLKCNLYGLVQALRNWFLKLSAIYERLGFKQLKSDPCLFFRKGMITVIYTDNCLL
jgi:hypothetical protein